MIQEEINQQIWQAFTSEMQEKYHLVYVHYDESFDKHPETIMNCMEKQEIYPLLEMTDDWYNDYRYENCLEIIEELKDSILSNDRYASLHPYIENWLDTDDNKDNLRYCIEERDDSDPMRELISRTRMRARITQYSKFDALPAAYDMQHTCHYREYFKNIVDTLHLNPAKVKQALINKGLNAEGNWINLTYRNGREAVEYEDFADEILNQNCYCYLVFMGLFPLKDMYEQGFVKYHQIIVPKGNICGLYSSFNGGGSLLGMELKRDLVLPLRLPGKTKHDTFDLDVDERNCNNGYCIDDVYGLIRAAWGKEFIPVYQSQNCY